MTDGNEEHIICAPSPPVTKIGTVQLLFMELCEKGCHIRDTTIQKYS